MHIISSMEVELFVFRKEAQIDYISVTLGFFFQRHFYFVEENNFKFHSGKL